VPFAVWSVYAKADISANRWRMQMQEAARCLAIMRVDYWGWAISRFCFCGSVISIRQN
jgi:hypothetical protein